MLFFLGAKHLGLLFLLVIGTVVTCLIHTPVTSCISFLLLALTFFLALILIGASVTDSDPQILLLRFLSKDVNIIADRLSHQNTPLDTRQTEELKKVLESNRWVRWGFVVDLLMALLLAASVVVNLANVATVYGLLGYHHFGSAVYFVFLDMATANVKVSTVPDLWSTHLFRCCDVVSGLMLLTFVFNAVLGEVGNLSNKLVRGVLNS